MYNRDKIENTEEYRDAMIEINDILEEEFKNQFGMGVCHRYWNRKKELLEQKGIYWKSPAEMNPDVIFD